MKPSTLETKEKVLPSNTTLNPPGAVKPSHADAWSLPIELRKRVKGEVLIDDGSRALYATDGSNYRQSPTDIVLPKSNADVIATIEVARQFGAPITGRGCGTSLAGQCCNVAVIVDMSKYFNKVLHIDVTKKLETVGPGCICDDLRHAAMKHGYLEDQPTNLKPLEIAVLAGAGLALASLLSWLWSKDRSRRLAA